MCILWLWQPPCLLAQAATGQSLLYGYIADRDICWPTDAQSQHMTSKRRCDHCHLTGSSCLAMEAPAAGFIIMQMCFNISSWGMQQPGDPARIVSVSSRLHLLGKLDPRDMQLSSSPPLVSLRNYSNSKLAQVRGGPVCMLSIRAQAHLHPNRFGGRGTQTLER